MRKQYFKLPDHIRVVSVSDGIVEADVDDFSEELQDRMRVMQHRLAEELDLPIELVADRLDGALHDLIVHNAFRGARVVSVDSDPELDYLR
tara:strand:- start:184 stop:456 length:273 start_codon:yes stop_codon:yes gene_type:complete